MDIEDHVFCVKVTYSRKITTKLHILICIPKTMFYVWVCFSFISTRTSYTPLAIEDILI
jgi:hypothetical protein